MQSKVLLERYVAFTKKIAPLAFLGVLALFIYGIVTTPTRPLTCKDYIIPARVISSSFVERHLKYPASSHVPGALEADFKTYCNDKLFRFDGWVDAANVFGAKQRMYYVQQLEYLGGDNADINSWKEASFNFLEE